MVSMESHRSKCSRQFPTPDKVGPIRAKPCLFILGATFTDRASHEPGDSILNEGSTLVLVRKLHFPAFLATQQSPVAHKRSGSSAVSDESGYVLQAAGLKLEGLRPK